MTKDHELLTLIILIIFSFIFFLIFYFLNKRDSNSGFTTEAIESQLEAIESQLQEFFIPDSSQNQALIDRLPVFELRDIVGRQNQLSDCAVCLDVFSETEMLRLLPVCNHAFHVNCIDRWLLSNPTCPICRSSISVPESPPCPGVPWSSPTTEPELEENVENVQPMN